MTSHRVLLLEELERIKRRGVFEFFFFSLGGGAVFTWFHFLSKVSETKGEKKGRYIFYIYIFYIFIFLFIHFFHDIQCG